MKVVYADGFTERFDWFPDRRYVKRAPWIAGAQDSLLRFQVAAPLPPGTKIPKMKRPEERPVPSKDSPLPDGLRLWQAPILANPPTPWGLSTPRLSSQNDRLVLVAEGLIVAELELNRRLVSGDSLLFVLLPITIAFDVATLPIQMLVAGITQRVREENKLTGEGEPCGEQDR